MQTRLRVGCAQPGSSVARVALSHGINANVVHKWRRLVHAPGTDVQVPTFVPVGWQGAETDHFQKNTIYHTVESALKKAILEYSMSHISANDLKTKGISAIELALSTATEAVVQVRGKDKFVVMDLAHYHYLRECELEAALAQTRADLAAGRVVRESAEAHLARLDAM